MRRPTPIAAVSGGFSNAVTPECNQRRLLAYLRNERDPVRPSRDQKSHKNALQNRSHGSNDQELKAVNVFARPSKVGRPATSEQSE